MADTKPCVCGGSNENCMHCFGRGFVSARRGAVVARLGFKPRRVRSRRRGVSTPTAPVKCALCGFAGDSSALIAHMVGAHRSVKFRWVFSSNTSPQAMCRDCKLVVAVDVMDGHTCVLPARKPNPEAASALSKPRTVASVRTCAICGASVKKLGKHIRKAHTNRPVQAAAVQNDEITNVVRSTDEQNERPAPMSIAREQAIADGRITPAKKKLFIPDYAPPRPKRKKQKHQGQRPQERTKHHDGPKDGATALERWHEELEHRENPVWPKNLDYTKPYAHAYRENGRFGSHPSHDGFDDESGA